MTELICVKHFGKSYCLDIETGQIRTFSDQPVAIKDCPEEVVNDLIKLLIKRAGG